MLRIIGVLTVKVGEMSLTNGLKTRIVSHRLTLKIECYRRPQLPLTSSLSMFVKVITNDIKQGYPDESA